MFVVVFVILDFGLDTRRSVCGVTHSFTQAHECICSHLHKDQTLTAFRGRGLNSVDLRAGCLWNLSSKAGYICHPEFNIHVNVRKAVMRIRVDTHWSGQRSRVKSACQSMHPSSEMPTPGKRGATKARVGHKVKSTIEMRPRPSLVQVVARERCGI